MTDDQVRENIIAALRHAAATGTTASGAELAEIGGRWQRWRVLRSMERSGEAVREERGRNARYGLPPMSGGPGLPVE